MATEVSNQLDRIEGGKDSIISSIEAKGVAVPDGAKIDELSPYVDAIASIKTCTVIIKFLITPSAPLISATVLSNGAISNYYNRPANATGTITIPNVVCGSALSVHVGVYSSLYGWSHGYNSNNDTNSFVLFVPTSEGTYTAEIGALDD